MKKKFVPYLWLRAEMQNYFSCPNPQTDNYYFHHLQWASHSSHCFLPSFAVTLPSHECVPQLCHSGYHLLPHTTHINRKVKMRVECKFKMMRASANRNDNCTKPGLHKSSVNLKTNSKSWNWNKKQNTSSGTIQHDVAGIWGEEL